MQSWESAPEENRRIVTARTGTPKSSDEDDHRIPLISNVELSAKKSETKKCCIVVNVAATTESLWILSETPIVQTDRETRRPSLRRRRSADLECTLRRTLRVQFLLHS